MNFPKFWYESNAVWGYVETFKQLHDKFRCSHFTDVEKFLTKSKKCDGEEWNFGTRREHNTDVTLKDFLIKCECYEEFINYCKQVEK